MSKFSSLLIAGLMVALTSGAEAALHSSGRWMVDDSQRVVMLHGVNVIWKTAPYYPPNSLSGFTSADADWLQSNGFNSVRLGVLFAGVMPQQGVIDYGYLNQVDRVVQLLAARNIYVLLDFHQDLYNEKFKGEGFPSWAVYDDGIPAFFTPGFPSGYITWNVNATYHNLYSNTNNLWSYYQSAWQAVAQRWVNQPYLMGYDVINEPAPGFDFLPCFLANGCDEFDSNSLQPFQEYMQAGIRQVDQKHIIWMEPNILFDFGIQSYLSTSTPVADQNNIGLSWHNYCLQGSVAAMLGVSMPPSCDQPESAVFDNADATSSNLSGASFMSEFGSSDDLGDIARMTQMADQHLMSWDYWSYKSYNDPTGSGSSESMFSQDSSLGSVKTGKLALLERTYPQATAGTPGSLYFDPATANFSYSYTPNTATAPTVIFVPTLHYPNGYQVSVTGARVISAANSQLLLLQNLPGSTSVQVSVWPR